MKIILHLGLPKTGSTFLQYGVFRFSKDINLVFKNIRNNYQASHNWLFDIVTNRDKIINQDKIQKKLPTYLSNNLPNLVSEETFYCRMFIKEDDRFALIDRIKKIFPEAKVMLGIRDKKRLLISWYKQFVAVGGTQSFDEFIKNYMNLNKLNYEKYIDKLKIFYVKDNIFIFKFEELIKNRHKTLEDICNFIGCRIPDYIVRKQNVGFSKKEMKVALLVNKLYRSEINRKGIPYPYKLIFLPPRLFFQNRIFSRIPKEKITLEELIISPEIKKEIDTFFQKINNY